MRRSRRHTINKLVFFIFLLVLAAIAVSSRHGLNEYLRLKQVYRDLLDDNVRLVNDNKRLRSEKEDLYNPASLEKLARESLGVVKEGEIIYVVEETADPTK